MHRDYAQTDAEAGESGDVYKEIMPLQQAAISGAKKPVAHEHEMLSVVLVRPQDQMNQQKKAPDVKEEPEDDIPAAEGDSSQFTTADGSNRYSVSRKEFSL